MWPFSEMSLPTATLVGTIANWILLISLLGGVFSTLVIVKSTDVKEEHWALARKQADERIASLNNQTARLSVEAETARKETAEARLQLEQLRKQAAARHIKRDEFVRLLEGKPKLPIEIMFAKDDGEAFLLALEIRDALKAAKWEAGEPFPIPVIMESDLAKLPSTMAVGGQPTGVTLAAHSLSHEEIMSVMPGQPKVTTPYTALRDALSSSLGSLNGSSGHRNRPQEGTLRVIVGSKPHPLN
jgi:hypothetical protein